MEIVPTALSGYRGVRADLLLMLKKDQPLTAKELGGRFGLTPNALRRHLKELEAEGTVQYRREIRGVGGPVFAYSLTPSGEALFPRAYGTALTMLLEQVRAELGTDGVRSVFEQQWSADVLQAKAELSRLPLAERAQLLAELLSAKGYMAEAESTAPGEATIREHNCAIRDVAERFPEVCAAEQQFLSEMLGAPVERQMHIVSGANCCEYCVGAGAVSGKSATTTATPRPQAAVDGEQLSDALVLPAGENAGVSAGSEAAKDSVIERGSAHVSE
jgi:DeoR family suf operon transcriptional repressor